MRSAGGLHTLLPVCAICNWRVERLTRLNPMDTTSMQFEVQCHGETERTTISLQDMVAPGFRLGVGVAFEKGRG